MEYYASGPTSFAARSESPQAVIADNMKPMI
jgi:hypothetical protein